MTESTARAERLDTPQSVASYYTWQVAQKPVAVRLPLPLIDRLEHESVEAFRSLTSRGSEIGGVLLGGVTNGNPSVVTIEDFELIECDYARGPLYRLSDADMGRFERAIEIHSGGSGLKLAGYFRSHTRKGLSLDAEDLAFFEPRFLDPSHIVMLVRPFATKASAGGIFIRENGRISSETSLLEFPFRSAELGSSRKLEMGSPSAKPMEPQASSSAAKAPVRAQIVPIASRREIAPEPEVAPPTAAPVPEAKAEPKIAPVAPAVKTVVPVVKESEKPKEQVKSKDQEKVKDQPKSKDADKTKEQAKSKEADKPKEKEKAAAPAKVEAPKAAKVEAAPIKTDFAFAALEEQPNKNKKLRLIVAAAVCMLVLVGGFLFLYPALIHRGNRPAATTAQDSSPIGLRFEKTTTGVLLSWNKDSEAIKQASKVVLSITDGERHENIQMDPNQVRTGSIVYAPLTGDISFQMEVTGTNLSKTASESLRVLDPRPSPLADPAATNAANAKPVATATPAKPAETAAVPAQEAAAVPVEEPAIKQTVPSKTFDRGSLANRLRAPEPTELPEAPAVSRSNNTSGGNLSALMGGATAVAAPAAPKSAEAAPNTTTPRTATPPSGGQITPAEPIFRKAPEYPKIARQTGAAGVVEVEAVIGIDGRVKTPKVTKGNPMLSKAALDAVIEWRYKPATLNGKAVESPVQIRLDFKPER